jgi:3-oxoacyl-[acyl-carrier protein] reductase
LLKNKICVVTGAAGNLGRATVKAFLANGAFVFALASEKPAYRDPEPQWLSFDASSEESVRHAWETIRKKGVKIDALINLIGGIYPWSKAQDIELDVWEKTLQLNLTTAFLCTREALIDMTAVRSGKIVHVGALAGLHGKSSAGPYGAAKAALANFTETVAHETRVSNIQVNMIIPGIIDTPANRKDMPDADFSTWVQPEEIAEVLVFLASNKSNCITGSMIKVTGKT